MLEDVKNVSADERLSSKFAIMPIFKIFLVQSSQDLGGWCNE